MEDIVISVKKVSKIYRLYDKPIQRLKEALSISKKCYHKNFEALHDVSFTVKKGEMLGIIGKNGSGKSTILKIITEVLTPTAGEVHIDGKVSALLELGAGFNMEYTGVENVYLNGSMIGFTREEMKEKLNDILDFADIGDFVYQPVKTYSSGMFARLAFAVAISVDPDILIVDESLSVGDVFFQAKCYKKLDELRNAGKTILFVTHDMGSVLKYCDRAVLLNNGIKVAEGQPKEMIDLYKKILVGHDEAQVNMGDAGETVKQVITTNWKEHMLLNPDKNEYGDGRAEIVDFGIWDEKGNISNTVEKLKKFTLRMKVQFNEQIKDPIFAFTIKDLKGTELAGTNTVIEKVDTGNVKKDELVEIAFSQTMVLQGGQYLIQLGCTGFEGDNLVVYHRLYDVFCLQVLSDKTTVGYCDMDTVVEYKRG